MSNQTDLYDIRKKLEIGFKVEKVDYFQSLDLYTIKVQVVRLRHNFLFEKLEL